MATVLPQRNRFAGLAEGLTNFLQGIQQQQQQKQEQADILGVASAIRTGQQFQPKTRVGANLLAQSQIQRAQEQRELERALAIQRAKQAGETTDITFRLPGGTTSKRTVPASQVNQFREQIEAGGGQLISGLPSAQTAEPNLAFKTLVKDGKEVIVGLDPKTGKEVTVVGEAPPNTTLRVVEDPNNPGQFVQQLQDEQGNVVRNLGPATPKQIKEGVVPDPVSKPTVTKIEKDVVDLQQALGELDAINEEFGGEAIDDFLTFRGGARKGIAAFAEKLEIPLPEAEKKFLADRTKFFADSKRIFLKFRKFITGVAGGIEEFREIAKSTIDPEKDSPTEFRAKMRSMRDNAQRLNNLMLGIRAKGFEPTEGNIRAEIRNAGGLSNIPVEVPTEVSGNPIDAIGEKFGF
jgi:hypothetical protein